MWWQFTKALRPLVVIPVRTGFSLVRRINDWLNDYFMLWLSGFHENVIEIVIEQNFDQITITITQNRNASITITITWKNVINYIQLNYKLQLIQLWSTSPETQLPNEMEMVWKATRLDTCRQHNLNENWLHYFKI